MDAHAYLTQNYLASHNVVKCGSCVCGVAAYATTHDLPNDTKVICDKGVYHNWPDVKLADPLSHLDPNEPSKPTIKRLFKACVTSWYDSHEAIPAQMGEGQTMAVLDIPYQTQPPVTHGTFIGLDADAEHERQLQVVLYRKNGEDALQETAFASKAWIERKAYQLWHLFKRVATNPLVLSNLGAALHAWVDTDGHRAWQVLCHCISIGLPHWLHNGVGDAVFYTLTGLLGNAISRRVFDRHYNRGPGMDVLLREGAIAFTAENLILNAAQVPAAGSDGSVVLQRRSDRFKGGC